MSDQTFRKYRFGTDYRISWPSLPGISVQPSRVDLIQEQYRHDILIIEYTTISPLYFSIIKTGIPIKFEWKQGNKNKIWVGYVSYISKELTPATQQLMQIHCVSASYPLKEKITRVFNNKTIPEIAEIIAIENGFKFTGDSDSRRFEQLTIAGHSYWEWLQEQAKRIGFAMVIDNTHLIFRSIDKLIDSNFSDVPVLSQRTSVGPTGQDFFDRTLDYFKVLNGEHIEGTEYLHTNKQVAGINPYTEKLITTSQSSTTIGESLRSSVSDSLFNEPINSQVTHNITDVESVTKGHAHMSRFNIPAKILCQGDPRFKPYGVIYVDGTGNSTDGHWIIKQVTHRFFKLGQYQVEMNVVTDGLNSTKSTAFRDTNFGRIGTVDLEANLLNNLNKPVKQNTSVLDSQTMLISMGNQGYLRTPMRWNSR
jgi:hypothetical protein